MQLSTPPKSAYIDGGLAAMLLQGALGGLLAAVVFLKGYWRSVKAWFKGDRASTAPAKRENDQPGS